MIRGRVVGPDGRAAPGAVVELEGADVKAHALSLAPDGEFFFIGVRDGAFRLVASREGFAPSLSCNIIVQQGQPERSAELPLRAP
jgi:hypothetical protein